MCVVVTSSSRVILFQIRAFACVINTSNYNLSDFDWIQPMGEVHYFLLSWWGPGDWKAFQFFFHSWTLARTALACPVGEH
jgi:hypothetical protein